MIYLVSILAELIFSLLALLVKDKRYRKDSGIKIKSAILNNKKFAVITTVSFLVISIAACIFTQKAKASYEPMLRWLILIFGVYIISYIDYREHLILNRLIIGLLVIRLCFLIYETIIAFENIKLVLIPPALGALIGGMIILVALLISRKGIGMGDVKLFTIIGLYVGSSYIVPTLFLSILFSALAGIFLLVSKKAKMKDSIPMAPFALAGTVASFILTYIGG